MKFLQELFGESALTFADFERAVSEKGFNLADLSQGGYVDEGKHKGELKKKSDALADLQRRYDELSGSVQGDEGLQKKYEQLEAALKKVQDEHGVAVTELAGHKRREAARKAGVTDDYAEYVSFEVGKGLKDGEEFDTALASWIKDKPQYKQKAGTAHPMGGDPKDDDAMILAARAAAGLKTS